MLETMWPQNLAIQIQEMGAHGRNTEATLQQSMPTGRFGHGPSQRWQRRPGSSTKVHQDPPAFRESGPCCASAADCGCWGPPTPDCFIFTPSARRWAPLFAVDQMASISAQRNTFGRKRTHCKTGPMGTNPNGRTHNPNKPERMLFRFDPRDLQRIWRR